MVFTEKYAVFDLETTPDRDNPKENRIIQVGAVAGRGPELVAGGEFNRLARCETGISPEVAGLTGVADEDVRSAPPLDEVMGEFREWAGDMPLIAHNGFSFDFPILDKAMRSVGLAPPGGDRLDTLQLAHLVFPRAGRNALPDIRGETPPPGRGIDDLIQHFAIAPERERHQALEDARLAQLIMARLLQIMNDDDQARRLQRWILGAGGHPWARFLETVAQPPPLAEILIEPPAESPLEAGGEFDIPDLLSWFEDGGRLMTDGRRPRPQQREMAQKAADALADKKKLLVEAPTGTGKTLAYLAPALAHARAAGAPVAVAPHTRVLQDQIMATLLEMEEQLGSFRWVVIKGMSNYLSLESLAAELDAGQFEPAAALVLALLAGWAAETPTGDWEDLRALSIEKRVPEWGMFRWKLQTDKQADQLSPLSRLDFYRRACDRAATSHVAVVNHALVILSKAMDPVRNLIVDEAHNMEDSVTSALTQEVTEQEVRFLCRAVLGRRGIVRRLAEAGVDADDPKLSALREAAAQAEEALPGLGTPLTEYVRSRLGRGREEAERFGISYRIRRGSDTKNPNYRPVTKAGGKLRDALLAVADAFNEITVPEEPAGRYRRDRLEDEVRRLGNEARTQAKLLDAVLWSEKGWEWINIAQLDFEDDAWIWSLRKSPISIAGHLGELWEKLDSVCLTSATLQVGGDFSYLIRVLGLETAGAEALPTPFADLPDNQLLLLTDYLPAPRGSLMERFAQAEQAEIPRLFTLTGGRGMTLFTARSRLETVRDHARPHLEGMDIPLLAQGEGSTAQLLEEMRDQIPACLLGARSFWEGVDLPGETLSLLLIEKVPFDSPADPVAGARMEQLEMQGKDPFTDYMVPRAGLRFAQGVGRLIRTETDRGVAAVLDNRLCRPGSYQEALRNSLVGPPRVREAFSPEEAYQEIADHLGFEIDDELRARIGSIPSADPWERRVLELARERDASVQPDEEAIKKRLEEARELIGFEGWRPGQVETMVPFMAGRDAVAVLPTGSGKSLTYQLPALLSPGLTLVISPLIALMRNQIHNLRARGVSAVAGIYSGVRQSEQDDILREAARGKLKLLYVSPERLWSPNFRSRLAGVEVSRVAVDEAHCISQWGHAFRPEYSLIPEALEQICGKRLPTLAVTATATRPTLEETRELLRLDDGAPEIVQPPDRPEIRYFRERCRNFDDRLVKVVKIVESFRDQSAIVYVPTRTAAANVAAVLRAAGHAARAYHGGMTTEERSYVEDAFIHDEIDVVAATKAFGMGIDKPDIALIVHLEMPASIEEYVQETGRAARELKVGTAVLLTAPHDCKIHNLFVKSAVPNREDLKEVWDRLNPGSNFLDLDTLLRDEKGISRAGAGQLALHYLEKIGAVRRGADCVLQGRVTVDARSRGKAESLREEKPELAERAGRILDLVEEQGGNYSPGWTDQLGCSVPQAESDLFEMARRDIVAFQTWKYGWTVERLIETEPDWPLADQLSDARRAIVEEKASQALQFARGDHFCLRASLLKYFGGEYRGRCGNCDVCNPELPRPWSEASVTKEQLVESLEPRRAVLNLLDWAEGRNFSRRNLERCLSSGGPPDTLPNELRTHPLYRRLVLLRETGVAEVVEEMLEEGLIEEEPRRLNGKEYQTLVLTAAGRAIL